MVYINVLLFLLLMRYAFIQYGKIDNEKSDKIYLVLSSITLALLTGLRGSYVGPDTGVYINNFLRMRDYSWTFALSEKSGRFEVGYKLLTKLVGVFTDSKTFFLLIIAVVFAIFLGIYINKNSKNRFLSILLYYTVSGFSFQLSGIRQSIAMSIVLISFEFLKERKLWKFIGTVFIASLFHKSALAIIPMYFVAYMEMGFKNFIIISGIGVFCCIYSGPVIQLANSILGYDYENLVGFEGGAIFVVLMYVITVAFSYIYMNLLKKQDNHNTFFFNMTFVSLIIYILRYFVNFAERISFYYQFAFIILLPNLVESIEDKNTKKFIRLAVVVLSCALFGYRCIRGGPNMYYYFFWQN